MKGDNVKYRLKDSCKANIATPEGQISGSFPKGVVAPKDETEQRVLDHLVSIGLAEVAPEKEEKN